MLIILVLVFISLLSFGLGYLAGQDVVVSERVAAEVLPFTAIQASSTTEGHIVASKNGTKYYTPGCAGAERIAEANKIWFLSATAAANAGYAPAANCKGI